MILSAVLASSLCFAEQPSFDKFTEAQPPSFDEFASRFAKKYNDSEKVRRQHIYIRNLQEIAHLNTLSTGAVFGVNEFSDLTPDEFKATRMLTNMRLKGHLASRSYSPYVASSAVMVIPSSKNWFLNATTPIRDQGQCGSCWAFSSVEQVESDWFLSGKSGWAQPTALSVQQVIDCDKKDAYGCSGTYPGGGSGYDYITQNGGLASSSDYPDTSPKSGEGGPCKKGLAIAGGTIKNYSYAIKQCDLPWDDCNNQDEDSVASYVGAKGPLSICVNAKNGWQFYKSGVLSGSVCGGHDHASLDHCVQLVGYSGYDASKGAKGSGATGAYWIVRNSWGAAWGANGLIYLAMGNNTCGVADVPSFAVV